MPDLVLDVPGTLGEAGPRATLDVPAGEERWIRLDVAPLATTAAAALVVADLVAGDGMPLHLDLRDDRGRLLAAARGLQRYGRQVSALTASPGTAPGDDVVGGAVEPWACLGVCVADRHRAGTYYLAVRAVGAADASVVVHADARRQGDGNEPNDVGAPATTFAVGADGDGVHGAIEYPTDVDRFVVACAPGFAGGDVGVRLGVATAFAGSLELLADDVRVAPGEASPVVPCGALVEVRSADGSAGPASASAYRIEAVRAPLYALDVTATASPVALGRVTLAPGETLRTRVRFGAGSAALRYVEVVGVDATADGRVQLDLRRESNDERIGVSRSRERFGSGFSALDAATPATVGSSGDLELASVGIVSACLGPCVLSPYASERLVARLTNVSSQSLSVDLYAYGGPAFDPNEPNDTVSSATAFELGAGGGVIAGAIEHVGDVDVFRVACGPSFPHPSAIVTLETAFPGTMVLRRVGSGGAVAPGRDLEVPCGDAIRVETTDGTAGPSATSRYVLDAR